MKGQCPRRGRAWLCVAVLTPPCTHLPPTLQFLRQNAISPALYPLVRVNYMCHFGWAMLPRYYSGCFCEGVF